jgi:hypothetical protein
MSSQQKVLWLVQLTFFGEIPRYSSHSTKTAIVYISSLLQAKFVFIAWKALPASGGAFWALALPRRGCQLCQFYPQVGPSRRPGDVPVSGRHTAAPRLSRREQRTPRAAASILRLGTVAGVGCSSESISPSERLLVDKARLLWKSSRAHRYQAPQAGRALVGRLCRVRQKM